MNKPLLEVRNLKKWFEIRKGIIPRPVGHVRAVDDVSFSIDNKEVLGLAGESGSGKTTIGRTVLRLVEPTSGDIVFKGSDITSYGSGELRRFRRDAQIIFQDPYGALNPRKTIERILSEPSIVQGERLARADRKEKVAELLDLVSLPRDYMTRLPDELSGGQRQRIVIARALAVRPKFIVADEPVSALDVSIQAQIIDLLTELKERLDLSMLFISHDLAVMEYLSNRIAVVYLGKIMEIGPASVICNSPQHPYTRALLSAVPGVKAKAGKSRIVLKGDLPNPSNPPSGCVFRTRCPWAIADCSKVVPQLRENGSNHKVACIRTDL